jgi:predicted enzyme related to lactoylglutathione lyase
MDKTCGHDRTSTVLRGTRATLVSALVVLAASGAATTLAVAAETPSPPFKPVDTLPRVPDPHLNFITLVVADFERSFRFYTGVLGMIERGRGMPDLKNFEVVMGFDDRPTTPGISLTYRNGPPQPRGNGSSSINLVVRDLAGIVSRVVPAGGKVISPLVRGESPKTAYSLARIEDPDGNALELVEYHRIGTQVVTPVR